MTTIVLIPGAFHTANCWERIVPLLAQHNYHVLTPDLAGIVGEEIPAATISLALWTDQIAALVSQQPEPVMLVGHSRGGIVASMVAERVPERITYLVYVSGTLLPNGGSILTHGPQYDPDAPSPLTIREDGMATIATEVARHAFLNRTAPNWAERSLSRLVAEPIHMFAEQVRITDQRFGSVRRAYIETTYDNGVPLDLQRTWQKTLPCTPVLTLATDHSPFYSDPVALTHALHSIATQ